jgi:hypothetical protein
MPLVDVVTWIDEQSADHIVWYVKRLSANDTLANGAHQAGPYIPKGFLFEIFPSLNRPQTENPDKWFWLAVDSHSDGREVRAVWYNNKNRGRSRDEARLTNFGGSASPLLDPDSTGALAVFAFHTKPGEDAGECHVWVCDSKVEEDAIEERIGAVEPGRGGLVWKPGEYLAGLFPSPPGPTPCTLTPEQVWQFWRGRFPAGAEIIRKTVQLRTLHGMNPDVRLLKRRACEFEIFRSVEETLELPAIHQGFQTIEEFVGRAQTILQRRKSRSGRSLELHAREIFLEEALRENENFCYQPESEPGKRPDFLFPSADAYHDAAFPTERLRMLAVKTTCKDRWRQILTEAGRVGRKHLLTLQEGVSENQFREMTDEGVQLVVPSGLHSSYPAAVRPYLQSLESFIGDVRFLAT